MLVAFLELRRPERLARPVLLARRFEGRASTLHWCLLHALQRIVGDHRAIAHARASSNDPVMARSFLAHDPQSECRRSRSRRVEPGRRGTDVESRRLGA
jgi:hypothetical protein